MECALANSGLMPLNFQALHCAPAPLPRPVVIWGGSEAGFTELSRRPLVCLFVYCADHCEKCFQDAENTHFPAPLQPLCTAS